MTIQVPGDLHRHDAKRYSSEQGGEPRNLEEGRRGGELWHDRFGTTTWTQSLKAFPEKESQMG